MKFFNFKTRKALKKEIAFYQNAYTLTNEVKNNSIESLRFYESNINRIVFRHDEKPYEVGEFAQLVIAPPCDNEGNVDVNKYNATLFVNEETGNHLYLSKKITDDYTHLDVFFRDRKVFFVLNKSGRGFEIDSNNRIKDKTAMAFLQTILPDLTPGDNKIQIFFEKI